MGWRGCGGDRRAIQGHRGRRPACAYDDHAPLHRWHHFTGTEHQVVIYLFIYLFIIIIFFFLKEQLAYWNNPNCYYFVTCAPGERGFRSWDCARSSERGGERRRRLSGLSRMQKRIFKRCERRRGGRCGTCVCGQWPTIFGKESRKMGRKQRHRMRSERMRVWGGGPVQLNYNNNKYHQVILSNSLIPGSTKVAQRESARPPIDMVLWNLIGYSGRSYLIGLLRFFTRVVDNALFALLSLHC